MSDFAEPPKRSIKLLILTQALHFRGESLARFTDIPPSQYRETPDALYLLEETCDIKIPSASVFAIVFYKPVEVQLEKAAFNKKKIK